MGGARDKRFASRDNFEGSSYIVSVPRLHCKVQQKIETEHCFFLLLTMQNELIQWNFAKFWRILGLLACAFRLGRTIRDDKEMTYWILRLHWGVWKETGEWWLCRFAVWVICILFGILWIVTASLEPSLRSAAYFTDLGQGWLYSWHWSRAWMVCISLPWWCNVHVKPLRWAT